MDSDAGRLGRYGSVWCAQTTAYTPATGTFFCAFTVISATIFATLTVYNHSFAGASSTVGVLLPAGSTIYGMWTSFQLTSGSVIAYKVASKFYQTG